MSAEHFSTIFTADIRSMDGRTREYKEAGTGSPRWSFDDRRSDGWVGCYMYAESVLEVVADTIREDMMSGISGDLPEHRELLADMVFKCKNLTRWLALDAACDGQPGDRWNNTLDELIEIAQRAKELETP